MSLQEDTLFVHPSQRGTESSDSFRLSKKILVLKHALVSFMYLQLRFVSSTSPTQSIDFRTSILLFYLLFTIVSTLHRQASPRQPTTLR